MTLALLRRDDALRLLPLIAVPLLLNASLLLGLAATLSAGHGSSVSSMPILSIGWLTIAIFLVFGPGQARCRPFDLGLPISARRLWLSHLSAAGLAVLALIGAYVAEIFVMRNLLGAGIARGTNLPTLALDLTAVGLLVLVLLHGVRLSLVQVPADRRRIAWTGVVLVASLGVLALLPRSAPWGALLALAAALVVGAIARSAAPPAFVLASRRSRGRKRQASARGSARRGSSTLTLLRCLTIGPKELASVGMTVLFGLFVGGASALLGLEPGMRDMRFLYLPAASYLLFALVAARLAIVCHLDPLPLSRRRIFAGLVLPGVVIFLASAGAGAVVAARLDSRTEFIDYCHREKDERWCFNVPLRVHRISWSGRAPEIVSPWGEAHAAEVQPLVRGLRAVLWNPYSAPDGSSSRFVAWQISRAAEAVYGLAIDPETIEQRWLERDAEGAVVGRREHLALRAEYPQLTPRSGPVFPVMMALVLAPWLLVFAILLRMFRAGISDRAPHVMFWGFVVLFIAMMIGLTALLVSGVARPWLPRALVEIPAWPLRGSAVAIGATWTICAAIVLAAYRVAQRQFARMEIPTQPLRFALLERMRQDRGPG